MLVRKTVVLCTLGTLGLGLLTGCFFPAAVGEEFQGGSSVTQAGTKFLNDRWDTMNPDDIQMLPIIAEQFGFTDGADLPDITDDQAQAIVDFIEANGIVTLEDLQQVVEQAADDPTSVVIPDSVRDVLLELAGSGDLSDEDADALGDLLGA